MLPYPLSTDPKYRRHATHARELRSRYIASLLRHTAESIVKTIAAFRLWRQRRRAIAELNRLDDRILKDMGLSRSQIDSVVHGLDDPRPLRPASRPRGATEMTAKDCIDAAVATGRMAAARGAQAKHLLEVIEADYLRALGTDSTEPETCVVPFAEARAAAPDKSDRRPAHFRAA